MLKRKSYDFLPEIAGPYVHAVQHGETIYLSGLTAYGTNSQKSELEVQTISILEQISKVLESETASVKDIIKVTIFVKDISKLASIRSILFDFYKGYLPACSLFEVSNLIHPDLQVEIEAVISTRKNL